MRCLCWMCPSGSGSVHPPNQGVGSRTASPKAEAPGWSTRTDPDSHRPKPWPHPTQLPPEPEPSPADGPAIWAQEEPAVLLPKAADQRVQRWPPSRPAPWKWLSTSGVTVTAPSAGMSGGQRSHSQYAVLLQDICPVDSLSLQGAW